MLSQEVYERLGGEPAGEVRTVEDGDIVDTYFFEDEGYFVQTSEQHSDSLKKGLTVYRHLEGSEIPVPDIIDFDYDIPYCITRDVGGVPLYEEPADENLYAAGQTLATLHETEPMRNVGPISPNLTDLRIHHARGGWVRFLNEMHSFRIGNIEPLFEEEFVDEILSSFNEGVSTISNRDTEYTLLHMDYGPKNLRMSDGNVNAVLDWDSAAAGDPDFDYILAANKLSKEIDDISAFHEGYSSVREPDMNEDKRNSYELEAELFHTSALKFLDGLGRIDLTEEQVERQREALEEFL